MSSNNHSGKLFLTGGNGFIGSHLLPLLIENGFSVKCLLRQRSNTKRIDHLEYEQIIGDIRDIACLNEGIRGCDGVIHLAAIASWADINSPHIHDVNVEGSLNILETAKKYNNLRTVYVSSAAAVGGTKRPHVLDESAKFNLKSKNYPYALAKVEMENFCARYVSEGLPIVIVNPTEVYGPEDTEMITSETLINFANSKLAFTTKGGTSIIHVEDVAKGIVAAYKQGKVGDRYILGGDNLSFFDLCSLTLDLLEQRKPIINIPHFLVRLSIILKLWFKLPLKINPAALEYALLYWFMDNKKAQRELGVHFRSARDTLAPTLKWLNDRKLITLNEPES